ncbi:MAG: HAD-IIB family hydrolase [Patescibacteria group bacterium]|nr:HAD-IIB family hydrolase [Patescibacteria group bacterium]
MIAPRLVAFDLDGTLAESKERMTREMGELLGELLKKMPVAVLSGGSWKQFEIQFFPSLPDEAQLGRLYLFPDNAAQCYVHREHGWRLQYDHALSQNQKERIVGVLHGVLSDVGLENAPARVWGERIEDRGAEIAFSPLGQQAPLPEKEEWRRAHQDLRAKVHALLSARLPDFDNTMGGLTTIDITPKGINKAFGIKRLSEMTKIPIEHMLYVGDALEEGGNDAVVHQAGIKTHEVFSPEETAGVIESILKL